MWAPPGYNICYASETWSDYRFWDGRLTCIYQDCRHQEKKSIIYYSSTKTIGYRVGMTNDFILSVKAYWLIVDVPGSFC